MTSHIPREGCCNVLTLQKGDPTGIITNVVDYRTYVAGELIKGGKVLVIFTDIYGLDLINTKLVADKFHEALGYTVVVPDVLKNDAYPDSGEADFNTWFANHKADEAKVLTQTFLKNFKREYQPSYTVGIGYCWGAKFVVQNLTQGGDFDVGAVAHPSFVSEEEIEQIAVPLIISAAQNDSIFPPENRFKTEQILNKIKAIYQIDLYSGTTHGFTVRGDRTDPAVKYAADKALTDQVTWFKRFDKDALTSCC